MQLLKFITCGSVDDGKSTLIGHMLYDAKLIFADQQRALELDSKVGSADGKIDYALLLDGLDTGFKGWLSRRKNRLFPAFGRAYGRKGAGDYHRRGV